MSENVRLDEPFPWTPKRDEAASLLAVGRLSDLKIAATLDITDRTLRRWQEHAGFNERVDEYRKRYAADVLRRGIAQASVRIDALNDRHQRLEQIIAERAEAGRAHNALAQAQAAMPPKPKGPTSLADGPKQINVVFVPGYETGLLVRQLKSVGSGPFAQIVEEYSVDVAPLAEMRNIEKHVAQEMGQWTDKKEISGPEGGPVEFRALPPHLQAIEDALTPGRPE